MVSTFPHMNLFGMTLPELQELCTRLEFPQFTAKQLCDWIYKKREVSIDKMTNLSLIARQRLNQVAYIQRDFPVDCQVSKDGTKKYLFAIEQQSGDCSCNQYVEAVFIPDDDRATLCISCQKGCKMGCRFCVTGKQGFHGNLTASQIVNQIFSIPEFSRLTNIVYMGMGEPMDNYDNIMKSVQILTSSWGLGWSPHRITVSTVGVIPQLKRFLDECDCHVAVSLHNPYSDERLKLMPMEKAYPIKDVVDLLKQYNWNGQRRISFEYIMFKNLNDDLLHADALLKLLNGLFCRVNIIRFHSSPDTPYHTSTPDRMNSFRNHLNHHGVICTTRASRGEDIMAACGLLAGKNKDNQ